MTLQEQIEIIIEENAILRKHLDVLTIMQAKAIDPDFKLSDEELVKVRALTGLSLDLDQSEYESEIEIIDSEQADYDEVEKI